MMQMFTYRLLTSLRWEVLRGDMVMGVFHSRGQAAEYCAKKNDEAGRTK